MIGRSVSALRTSITARLTILFTAAVILLLILHGAYHYRSLTMQLKGRQAATLTEKLTAIQSRLAHHESADLIAGNARDVMEVLAGHSDLFLVIRDGSGRVLAASHPEDLRPSPPVTASLADDDLTWPSDQNVYRTIRVGAMLGAARAPVAVELTVDTTSDSQILRAFVREVSLGMLVGVLIAGAMAFFIARQGLGALNRFARAASDITVSRLNRRLDLDSTPLELRELVASYNGMLERLEMSFRQLVDFSGDLAHELRTPIHNLLGQTQVALSGVRAPEEYRRVLESNVEEYERLSRMIRDMLFLAQADNAQLTIAREKVDLSELAKKVASLFEAAFEEHRVAIIIHGHGTVKADRLMLERALGNLLSNALAHATPASRIRIALKQSEQEAIITVANHGDHIPPEVSTRLFDRFFRADTARHGEGAGLGLAIVKSIVELHGGTVAVDSDAGGETQFTLHIPVASSEAEIAMSGNAITNDVRGTSAPSTKQPMASAFHRSRIG